MPSLALHAPTPAPLPSPCLYRRLPVVFERLLVAWLNGALVVTDSGGRQGGGRTRQQAAVCAVSLLAIMLSGGVMRDAAVPLAVNDEPGHPPCTTTTAITYPTTCPQPTPSQPSCNLLPRLTCGQRQRFVIWHTTDAQP